VSGTGSATVALTNRRMSHSGSAAICVQMQLNSNLQLTEIHIVLQDLINRAVEFCVIGILCVG